MLTSILNELESFLIEKNYPIIKKLNDGLTEDEIIDSLKQLNLNIPQKLIDLYKWKNGVVGLIQTIPHQGFHLKQFTIINASRSYLPKVKRIRRDNRRAHQHQQQDQRTPICSCCFRNALV